MPIRVRRTTDGRPFISSRELQEEIFGARVPEAEQWRRYFGSSVTPSLIESVLRQAECGYMRDLTDLEAETLFHDGHYTSVVGKRMRALASVEPQVIPAEGSGIDPAKAKRYAGVVESQLRRIRRLRQHLISLNWSHFHGRGALEKHWEENPGGRGISRQPFQSDTDNVEVRWRLKDLSWLHPRRLAFGPDRELRLRDDRFAGGRFEKRGFELRSVPFKFVEALPRLYNEYPEREGFGPRGMYFALHKRFSQRERMVLLEVFGKPWRIILVEPNAEGVDENVLNDARQQVDTLGANSSAALAPGLKVQTEQPDKDAGNIHSNVVEFSNDEISKIVVGQTRTTDASGDGLGAEQSLVHERGEELVFSADGWDIGEWLTEHVAWDIIELNFGADELDHAPTIELKFERPPDREQEIERLNKFLDTGLPVKAEEAYEVAGFTKPDEKDEVIRREKTAPDPFGNSKPTGVLGGGDDDPPGDGKTGPGSGSAPSIGGEKQEAPPGLAARASDGSPVLMTEIAAEQARLELGLAAFRAHGEHVCMARQPETVNGTPEHFIDGGVREAAREAKKWTETLAKSVDGLEEPSAIFRALSDTARGLPLSTFARATERRMLQGLMIGALDSVWERENDEEVKPEAFRAVVFAVDENPGFARQPFDNALRWFRTQSVLTKDAFEQLSAAAKRRSFTIARLASQEMLAAAHAELSRQLAQGPSSAEAIARGEAAEVSPSLREFGKFVRARLESAGWTPANPSHVETVFRTNVLNAYSAGRHSEMTQPEVLAARPLWQWRAVGDDRTRPKHKDADGTVLPATDSFWTRNYPPAGYNCRCRVVSRSQAWAERRGVRLVAPREDVFDEGFGAGTAGLLAA